MLSHPLEIRAEETTQQTKIVGYAAKFNQWSADLGGFIERIDPKAFEKCDMADVRALIDHDASRILGRTVSGTLKLSVDDIGLRYEIITPDTSYARDLVECMNRGDINQSSFGFRINYDNAEAQEWRYNKDTEIYERTIYDFRQLLDVSVVTYPAYSSTESVVSQRSLDELKSLELQNEMEKRKLLLDLDLMLLAVDEDDEEKEEMEETCPSCGGEVDEDNTYCPTCGGKLPTQQMTE